MIYFLSISILVFNIFATDTHEALPEGEVAHYTFNDCDAREAHGNKSNGSLFGGVGCWCGIEDDGLLFDGVDDYVIFYGEVNRYFNTSDFTISFYFKPEQYNVFQQSMLGKRAACDEEQMFDILLNLNDRQVQTEVYESSFKHFGDLSPALIAAGWHHFALVREGLKASTYINGQLQKESYRCSGIDISNESPLSFSDSPCIKNGRTRRFQGVLDELRVFNRALSKEEIRQLYEQYPIENAKNDCVS